MNMDTDQDRNNKWGKM